MLSTPNFENPLFQAATDVQGFCAERGWQCAIIGGLAVQRWGEPRQTRDVDVALLTGFGSEASFVDALLERYAAPRGCAAVRHHFGAPRSTNQ
jgi:hypothetical protein